MLTPKPPPYKSGYEAAFFYADEPGSLIGNPPNPPLPSSDSFVWNGWVDVPKTTDDQGSREVYGLGSKEPQVIISGGRTVALSVPFRLTNLDFLQGCVADKYQCFLVGSLGDESTKECDAVRFAKCGSWEAVFNSGSAQDVRGAAEFWAITTAPAAKRTPTAAQIATSGEALTWHDVKEINIKSANMTSALNVRNICFSARMSANYNLRRGTFRSVYDPPSIWGGTTYAIERGISSYRAVLDFDTPEVKMAVLKYANGETAIDSVEIVTSRFSLLTSGQIAESTRGGNLPESLSSSLSLITKKFVLTAL